MGEKRQWCLVCNRRIFQEGRGRPRKTCSEGCRSALYRMRRRARRGVGQPWLRCQWCRTGFRRKHRYGPDPMYCSERCSKRAQRQRKLFREGGYDRTARNRRSETDYEWVRARVKEGRRVPICKACDVPFRDNLARMGRPREYCTVECRDHARVERRTAARQAKQPTKETRTIDLMEIHRQMDRHGVSVWLPLDE